MSAMDAQVLERLKGLSRGEMQALQLGKLKAQLARQYAGNQFYRDRFGPRFDVEAVRDLKSFAALVPTMGKKDCLADQAGHPPFGHRVGVPREKVAMVNLTGGTSGQGQEIYGRTMRDIAMQGYLHYLPWHIAGLRRGDLALNCVPAGGLTTGGWGPGEGFRMAGATAFSVGGNQSTDAKIDLMLRFRDFAFIYASTSYLNTLTQALRGRGIDPRVEFPRMKSIFIAAEGYPIDWAVRTQEFWGVPIQEGYGSTQGAGFIACTVSGVVHESGRGAMHVFDWHNVVEVLDPETLGPVEPGQEGEVVLTNLDIVGSPVIRFRTGDKVRLLAPDHPSVSHPWTAFEAGGIGRIDDMIKIRGNNVWPNAIDAILLSHKAVDEYAGRVFTSRDGRTQVEVRLALSAAEAPEAAALDALLASLKSRIKAATNVSMDLCVVARSELPNYDYKSRRWKDERLAGLSEG